MSRKAANKRYQVANKERLKVARLKYRLKVLYGLTVEQYELMVADQAGHCAMCGKLSKRALHIDHDHKTGKARGLLCTRCNVSLGVIEQSELVAAALAYLERYRK